MAKEFVKEFTKLCLRIALFTLPLLSLLGGFKLFYDDYMK